MVIREVEWEVMIKKKMFNESRRKKLWNRDGRIRQEEEKEIK